MDRLIHRMRAGLSRNAAFYGLLILCAGWIGVNYPGLSQMGLWDPWEMNRAQMARQMNEVPRVFVVEPVEPGESLGPIGSWLAARYQSHLNVASVEPPRAAVRNRNPKTRAKQNVNLDKALTRLDTLVVHMVVIDVTALVPDTDSQSAVKVFTEWFDRVRARNPGVPCLMVVRSDTPDDVINALQQAVPVARAQLAANDLSGQGWGRAGGFRKSMHTQLRNAAKDGYSPIHETLVRNDAPDSFLDQGFWDAAKQHRLKESMSERWPEEVIHSIRENEAFALQAPMVEWPNDEEYGALRTNYSGATSESRELMAGFEREVDSVFGSPTWKASLKTDGVLRTVPPLDSWLVAQSMRLFGFSERAVRLPSFLLGLLGLFLLYWIVWRVWDERVALLSGLVLLTCPLYFAQGHLVASELSFVVALMLVMGGLLFLVQEERVGGQALTMLALGAVMAFLSQGVYGLILPTVIAVTYLVITRRVSLLYLTATLMLGLLLSAAWVSTHAASAGSFWAQFGIHNVLAEWNINVVDRPVDLNFDVLVRQIGFGAAPWSALLPLAFAGLLMQRIPEGKRPAVLIVLWFIVPYVIQSFLLKDFTHLVFPAIPALAVAVGLLLDRLLRGQALGLIGGLIVAILSLILINELNRTPEPLTSFLTVDPPMYGKTSTVYPEDLKLSKTFLGVMGLMALVFFMHASRLGSRMRQLLKTLGQPRAFWIVLCAALTLLVVRLVLGLEGHIADFYAAAGPARHLEPVHRLFVRSVFYWRPETWAVGVFGLGVLTAALWHHTDVFGRVVGWIKQWIITLPVAYVFSLVLGLVAVIVALSDSRDALDSVVQNGAYPFAIAGIAFGVAVVVAAARSGHSRSLLRWVLVAALIRLIAQPGSDWLKDWDVGSSLGSYALFEALVTSGIAILIALVSWALSARGYRLISSLALAVASLLLALPSVEPTTPWELLAVASSRMVLLATVVDLFQGAANVRAVGQRVAPMEFLLAPLSAVAVAAVGFVVGLAVLAFALVDDASPQEGSVVTFLSYLSVSLACVLVVGVVFRKFIQRIISKGLGLIHRMFGPLVSTLDRWQGNRRWVIGGTIMAILLLGAAMERVLAWGDWAEGFAAWATWQSPVFWLGMSALGGWLLLAWLVRRPAIARRIFSEDSWLHGLRGLTGFSAFWLGAALIACWVVGGCVTQLFRGSGQTLTDYMVLVDKTSPEAQTLLVRALAIGGLIAGAALVGVATLWRFVRDNRRAAIGLLIGTGLAFALIILVPLCRKWLQLESRVVSTQAEPFLAYLFGKSRTTGLLYVLIVGAVGLRFVSSFSLFAERLRTGRRLVELLAVVLGLGLVGTAVLWGRTASTTLRFAPLALALIGALGLLIAAWPSSLARLLQRLRGTGTVLAIAYALAVLLLATVYILGWQSSLAWILMTVLVLALLLLGVNWMARWVPPHRAIELVERPRVFVPIVALIAFGFALLYNNQLVNALSYHVSQKHLIETVQESEEGADYQDRLFQTGIGKSSSDNFYTRNIPSVRSQDLAMALRALSGGSDQVLPVSLPGNNNVEHRVVRAFSTANDLDKDGRRDEVSDAGLMTELDAADGWVEDETKSWVPDQWKDQWLIDSDGWIFPISSNTTNRIHFEAAGRRITDKKKVGGRGRKTPRFSRGDVKQNRYVLDSPTAADHTASANAASKRLYFLMPKTGQRAPSYSDTGSFSDLNYQYRKLSGGRHLHVLDDRSSQILLATNALRSGEEDKNWIRAATLDESDYLSRVQSGFIRGADPKRPLAGIVNWENKLLLLGWYMDSYALSKGQSLRIHLVFKVLKPLGHSMKIFTHIDRAGHRIHGDHWPHPVKEGKEGKHCIGCFQTNHWLPGDIVVDSFKRDVPIGAPSGTTDIWMGLFNPQNDKRLPVTKWDRKTAHYPGKDNRVRVGSFEVR